MGNAESNQINNLESINKLLLDATSKAQKYLHKNDLKNLQNYFDIEFPENIDEEEKTIENAILTPKYIKVKMRNGDVSEIPICTLVSMDRIDIKNINIKTKVEIKNLKPNDVLLCAKYNNTQPNIELDIDLERVEPTENVHRILQKFSF